MKKILLAIILFASLVYSDNTIYIPDSNKDGDTVNIHIKGDGEECTAVFCSDGTFSETDCLQLTNSKGDDIFCTKTKKTCKTHQELSAIGKEPFAYIKPVNGNKSMELLNIFAVDENADYNMYDWNIGTNETSQIDWEDIGPREALDYEGKPRVDYPYMRDGVAIIENHRWNVSLLGARGGYIIVELSAGFDSDLPTKLNLDKKQILEEKHCEESASVNTSMYLLKFKNKKPFWLKETFSSGSGGNTYDYTIMFDEKPKCDESLSVSDTPAPTSSFDTPPSSLDTESDTWFDKIRKFFSFFTGLFHFIFTVFDTEIMGNPLQCSDNIVTDSVQSLWTDARKGVSNFVVLGGLIIPPYISGIEDARPISYDKDTKLRKCVGKAVFAGKNAKFKLTTNIYYSVQTDEQDNDKQRVIIENLDWNNFNVFTMRKEPIK